MLALLEKIAVIYSAITLFVIEILIQIVKVIISGTRYSFMALINTLSDAFFAIIADFIMLLMDLLQSCIEALSFGWNKALTLSSEFNHANKK